MAMHEMKLEKAKVEQTDDVVAFVSGVLEEADCPIGVQMQLEMAIEEMFLNIAKYAYAPDEGPAIVRVEVKSEPPAALITFIDRGVPFNPLAKPDPDLTLPAEERMIGGLGILMTKKTMDHITYERTDGQNILLIEKLF